MYQYIWDRENGRYYWSHNWLLHSVKQKKNTELIPIELSFAVDDILKLIVLFSRENDLTFHVNRLPSKSYFL